MSRLGLLSSISIADGLDAFRCDFEARHRKPGLSSSESVDGLDKEDLRSLACDLVIHLADLVPETASALDETVTTALSSLVANGSAVGHLRPLLKATLADELNEKVIWELVSQALDGMESNPPPEIRSSLGHLAVPSEIPRNVDPPDLGSLPDDDQDFHVKPFQSFVDPETPCSTASPAIEAMNGMNGMDTIPPRTVSSSLGDCITTSEVRRHVDPLDFGPLFTNDRGFHARFFQSLPGNESLSSAVFQKCQWDPDPFYDPKRGWKGWPGGIVPDERAVFQWFENIATQLMTMAHEHIAPRTCRRPHIVAQPNPPLPGCQEPGSVVSHMLNFGFMSNDAPKLESPELDSDFDWSQVLVLGQLESDLGPDINGSSWMGIAVYARMVFARQDSRRFVLGFTICRADMRIWLFDRVGMVASDAFNVNSDGKRFVETVLGFLMMNDTELGFDPTIISSGTERYIEIKRNRRTERLIIDGVLRNTPCIAGRATTCWKAHSEASPGVCFVIKDSWQDPSRPEEGEMLRQATRNSNVDYIARYYHHETVLVQGGIDDVYGTVRRNRVVSTNRRPSKRKSDPGPPASRYNSLRSRLSIGGANEMTEIKPEVDPTEEAPPSSNPYFSFSMHKNAIENRHHRRVVMRDCGKPIYTASSHVALLSAFVCCLEGHESLRKHGGILHRDISVNNMMINEDEDNPSYPAFLIDLDLAISERGEQSSGAKEPIGVGTRPFMAIGLLKGERHSFMHDLESFFWVLLWICTQFDGPGEGEKYRPEHDEWEFIERRTLVKQKLEIVSDEDFKEYIDDYFTSYYQPLGPVVGKLREVVFPNGRRWRTEDPELYSRMIEVLMEGQRDLRLVAAVKEEESD